MAVVGAAALSRARLSSERAITWASHLCAPGRVPARARRARPSRISLTNAMIAVGVSYVLIVA
jgi:hypothetical protein